PEWWSGGAVTISGATFTQMEANFSLFWGLAIQLFESTLVANDSRVDRFLEGDTTALSGLEQQGMDLFTSTGRCINCHGGAECTKLATVDATFKTPALRNVELTGPYFHAGAKGTLRQVVQFYNRGGDFARLNIANLDPDIQPLGLTLTQMDALVAFLQALTDERTRQDKAPFDHPSLLRPNGCLGNDHHVEDNGSG